jgi:1-acyl-sn-glycerol-3-phosphate acyltransferase
MNIRSKMVRFYFFVLSRRYKINTVGIDLLKSPGAKLILPNHQSHIDPQLLAVITAKYCDFVPVVSENILKIPVIRYFLKKWNAIAVNDLKGNKKDPDVLKNIFSQVMKALHNNKTVIIYPSGQITHTPLEKIINKQSAFVIVSSLPDNVRVIGVRISGLWGSMWSVAWKGERPNFVFTFLKGIFYFFANFIFFSPRRHVKFEFVDITAEAKEKAKTDRRTFNNYLEEFYNSNGVEEASYIKHLFYLPKQKRNFPV